MFESDLSKFLLTTTRIETKDKKKNGVATGFYYSTTHEEGPFGFVVTNKHVIKNKDLIRLYFLKSQDGNPALGSFYRKEFTDDVDWICHSKYDLAILPVEPLFRDMEEIGEEISLMAITPDIIPSQENLRDIGGIGDVYFIGYPDGLWDTRNYLPILRKGVIATHLEVDYGGQKRFLIDANVIPGSSGSPVFVYQFGMVRRGDSIEVDGVNLFFVGILDITFRQRPKIGTVQVPIPLVKEEDDPQERIAIGGVISSQILLDFVEKYFDKK